MNRSKIRSWLKVSVSTTQLFFLFLLISACSGGGNKSTLDSLNSVTPNPRPFYNELDSSKSIDIIISYGQSNAAGFGLFDSDSITQYINSSNQMAQKCIVEGSIDYNSACIELVNITSPTDIYLKGKYSSWISFDQKIDSLGERTFLLINAAGDGQTLKSLLPGGEDIGPQNGIYEYENLISAVKFAIENYGYASINTVSVIWLHGERDANIMSQNNLSNEDISLYFEDYFNDLTILRDNILNDLGIPKLYFFINRVGLVEEPMFSSKFRSILNDLGYWQIEFCRDNYSFTPLSTITRTFSLQNNKLSGDGIHYTSLGYNELGNENATNWDLYMSNTEFENIIYNNNELYSPSIVVNPPYNKN